MQSRPQDAVGRDTEAEQYHHLPSTAPLISSPPPPPHTTKEKKKPLPRLPWIQLTVLAICRLADPVALSSVFPYLPEMIESFAVPEDRVSQWAGITSAVFSLSQAVTGVLWGRASDVFGRKPVILCGMLSIMSSSILFGFSRNLTWAVVTRALSGAGNGNVGLVRTVVAELVTEKELQPRAFSIMPLVWQIGCALGPVIGGLLANPVQRYPDVFGGSRVLREYPFALPNLVAGGFFMVGLIAGVLFLQETMESKKHRRDIGLTLGKMLVSPCTRRAKEKHVLDDEQAEPLLQQPDTPTRHHHGDINGDTSNLLPGSKKASPPKPTPPTWAEIFTRQSNINLLVYTLLALHSIAYDQLLPVYMHYERLPTLSTSTSTFISSSDPSHPTPPSHFPSSIPPALSFNGGLSLSTHTIGLLFTGYAILGIFIQTLIFPRLALVKGSLWNLKVVSLLYPLIYLLTPFTTTLLPATPRSQLPYLIFLMAGKSYVSTFAFPCSTILLTNSASSLKILGTLNGIAVSVSAVGRAAGPFIAGSTFTIGVHKGWGVLPWWVLAGCAAAAAVPVWWLEEGRTFGERAEEAEGKIAVENGIENDDGDDGDGDGDDDEDREGEGEGEGEREGEEGVDGVLPMRR